jgi:hypothetical protein
VAADDSETAAEKYANFFRFIFWVHEEGGGKDKIQGSFAALRMTTSNDIASAFERVLR